jgi:hypothetical protein
MMAEILVALVQFSRAFRTAIVAVGRAPSPG